METVSRPRMTVGGGKADSGKRIADIRLLVIYFIHKLAIYAVPAAE